MSVKRKTPVAPVEAGLHPDDVKQFTQQQVADRLRVNRTTILRMEQKGEIPQPTWARLPTPHRVYSENDIKVVKVALQRKGEKAGRVFLEPDQELTHKVKAGLIKE